MQAKLGQDNHPDTIFVIRNLSAEHYNNFSRVNGEETLSLKSEQSIPRR